MIIQPVILHDSYCSSHVNTDGGQKNEQQQAVIAEWHQPMTKMKPDSRSLSCHDDKTR